TTGGARYAIPQINVLELVRNDRPIEFIHGAPVYRLRQKLLPIVHLNGVLGLPVSAAREGLTIVVLRAGSRPFGLVVDEVNDTQEIVVKPFGRQLKGIEAFAGATILGDGRVALILDVRGIAHRA